MTLELLPENSPELHVPATQWDFDNDGSPEKIVSALKDIMFSECAVGIAAPQCGINKAIFLIYEPTSGLELTVINPKIVSLSPETELEIEGCLSFPDLFMKVKRNKNCVVQFQDVEGNSIEKELNGFQARVFLHEFDHTLGVTFNERVADLTFKMAKDKRKKMIEKTKRSLKSKANA